MRQYNFAQFLFAVKRRVANWRDLWYDTFMETINVMTKFFPFPHSLTCFEPGIFIVKPLLQSTLTTLLKGISELDETYVLESLKGRKFPKNAGSANLNNVNSFHFYIQERYSYYRGFKSGAKNPPYTYF